MDTSKTVPGGQTVLVVDDDRDAQEILTRTLESAGYRVIAVGSGVTGLEVVARERVDVILLDVMMPDMDGLAMCTELRKSPRATGIPIILLTAKDDIATRVAGMRLGVSEYVTKPVNIHEVLNRVRNQIHAGAIRRQLEDSAERVRELTNDKTTS
jgi:two-component system alkaline phosphatase synthesis response regulator PhoP